MFVCILIMAGGKMSSRKKVSYFYDPDVGNFHYGTISQWTHYA